MTNDRTALATGLMRWLAGKSRSGHLWEGAWTAMWVDDQTIGVWERTHDGGCRRVLTVTADHLEVIGKADHHRRVRQLLTTLAQVNSAWVD